MSDATIIEAQAAWQRIKDRDKPTFDDWLAIGRALIAGRQECIAKAGVNTPYGPAYQKLMRVWLDENGLADVDSQERRGAIHCVEHQAEIDSWRDGLTDVQRRRANHPNTIVKHWRRLTAPQKQGPKRSTFKPHPRAYARPVHWGQEAIRRASHAIRECRSVDCMVLARAALEAAIQSEADLFQLLERVHAPARPEKVRASPMAEAVP
ncbi:hypothetical protein [Bradyrhizobium sp. F1.4.3]|uniref:hypothetical protein n=1 Tax=Bradyrhizobium sp. F1.4.3 TaxID=3156356 RepID=UPI003397F0D8